MVMNVQHYLDYLLEFLKEIRSFNSILIKEEILKKWWKQEQEWKTRYTDCNELERMLHYVYDADKQYNITSAQVLNGYNKQSYGIFDASMYQILRFKLWGLLDKLSSTEFSGQFAVEVVNKFLTWHSPEHKKLILDIIDKDIKCGLTIENIVSVIPDFLVSKV